MQKKKRKSNSVSSIKSEISYLFDEVNSLEELLVGEKKERKCLEESMSNLKGFCTALQKKIEAVQNPTSEWAKANKTIDSVIEDQMVMRAEIHKLNGNKTISFASAKDLFKQAYDLREHPQKSVATMANAITSFLLQ